MSVHRKDWSDIGRDLFERRCSGCHAIDRDKEGPRLRGVYGRRSGSVPSFNYSDALRNAEITWDAETLDRWLTDPEKLVPGNDMAFQVVNPAERKEIIRYLQQLSTTGLRTAPTARYQNKQNRTTRP